MYDSLKVETSGTWPLRSVYGNILVAKLTYDGCVCDVEEKDRSLIEMLVYSFIEDEASYHQFLVIKHPLRPDHTPFLVLSPISPMQSTFEHTPIYQGDLLMNMVPHFHWLNLIMLLNFPSPGPEIAEKEIRLRIFDALTPFIPKADIPEFFDVLDMCDGAVIGSVMRQILLSGSSANISPFDLNVILAHDREDPLNSFLYRLGYQSSVEEPVKELCGNSVDRVEVYRRGTGADIQRITALVSKEEAISVLLRSPFTGQMNALTSTTLGSYYPRLTFRNESLSLEGFDQSTLPASVRPPTFALYPDNSHWSNPCGIYCPATWRKTRNDRGLALYRWSAHPQAESPPQFWGRPAVSDVQQEHLWTADLLSWKLCHRCANPNCPNMGLYDSRSQFLLV
ncbi:hypothetical protein DFP72DRAFT_854771 [Ephemerocybe angulata]|uniref:Uncharacterized protein n=1 Tax=Ephemerocybe angulata TaxID=980116 RepID=A0A8H6HHE5_9AGAR|nr:hypothetical protein DFP72DRAFT_854771 [Tulosesus angulatus]